MELITAQIALDPDQLQALTEESQRRKVSIDEILSRILSRSLDDYLLRQKKRQADPMSLIGLGEDEVEEVSEKHDAYLGEIIANEHLR
ncbi:MAG: hypothetical protein DKINENOH_01113 [bacterium]|nr:hypothetical protein [bacterium]MCK6561211.1 hypothetical protein [bacterium]NUM65695.1 hypothetical protein [candidate division KSB1 bacterium]